MALTSETVKRDSRQTTVTVVSDLASPVFYHWYIDGQYMGFTTSGVRTFYMPDGDQARIQVNDTTDADYDPIANAPAGYPARRLISWDRSLDDSVGYYRAEQKLGAGAWVQIGIVNRVREQWSYSLLTPRLTDLSAYTWQVVPVDKFGNDGTVLTIGPETIVRTPDAPDFTLSLTGAPPNMVFTEV